MKPRTELFIRFFDVFLSLFAIVVLAPFMLPIIIGLLLTGEHQIIYKQDRVGKQGKEFRLLKFATMVKNAPNLPGGMHTQINDPRLLPMGRFLRKTKINELPQLINVLIGDMSIIGYRPTVSFTYEMWPKWAKDVLKDARPGVSGIGSIVFRNEEELLQKEEHKIQYYVDFILPYKMDLECWYQKNKSVLLYWKLILLTIDAITNGHRWKRINGLPDIPKKIKKDLAEVAKW